MELLPVRDEELPDNQGAEARVSFPVLRWFNKEGAGQVEEEERAGCSRATISRDSEADVRRRKAGFPETLPVDNGGAMEQITEGVRPVPGDGEAIRPSCLS